jgi:hypothetical protein
VVFKVLSRRDDLTLTLFLSGVVPAENQQQ